jgi:hypothetical protein
MSATGIPGPLGEPGPEPSEPVGKPLGVWPTPKGELGGAPSVRGPDGPLGLMPFESFGVATGLPVLPTVPLSPVVPEPDAELLELP